MNVRITVLSDNTVNHPGLMGEHGLSFLIERGDKVLLFDTGQGQVLRTNAERLKIDLSRVRNVVLSHGHYDHTGGLKTVLAQGREVSVFAHPEVLGKKLSIRKGQRRAIGIPWSQAELEHAGAVFHLSTEPMDVADGMMTTGQVRRITEFEDVDPAFYVEQDGKVVHDDLMDDLSLIVDTPQGLVLLLGCCHAGVINTLWRVVDLTGTRRFAAVIGGMHLTSAKEKRLHQTIHALRAFDIQRLVPGHCTGLRGFIRLWNELGEDTVHAVGVGDRWSFS